MHEDANKFIQDFESYCILTNIHYDTEPGKANVALSVTLTGPRPHTARFSV